MILYLNIMMFYGACPENIFREIDFHHPSRRREQLHSPTEKEEDGPSGALNVIHLLMFAAGLAAGR